ncbi:MAG: TlpA family protein disulfide reductase [Saprospiraceae bacterium]|nr:TlpA family protein disulfide reductase [Saprospiraceae bacterium]
MKNSITFFLIFYLVQGFSNLKDNAPTALILKGKLENNKSEELYITFQNKPGIYVNDTIHIKQDGSFYFKSNKITKPQSISAQGRYTFINGFFVAPGFDLEIYANVKDFDTTNETIQFKGKGSECNAFRSTILSRYNWPSIFNDPGIKKEDFLNEMEKLKRKQESLYNQFYSSDSINEPFYKYFKEVVLLDATFDRLNQFMIFTIHSSFDFQESVDFISRYFDVHIWENLIDDKYMKSDVYLRGIVNYHYLIYLKKEEYQNSGIPSFSLITNEYDGRLMEYVAYYNLYRRMIFSRSFHELEVAQIMTDENEYLIRDTIYKEALKSTHSRKFEELSRNIEGSPCPDFVLRDKDGGEHRLSHFSGKVVILDFWASWCGPCKNEFDYLKPLVNFYKNDSRIVFIGITVRDDQDKWIKSLLNHDLKHLQLFDDKGVVDDLFNVNYLPRYLMIDKKGNFIKYHGPRPSDTNQFRRIIEMALGV